MDWTKTTAQGYKKHLNFGIWCDQFYFKSAMTTMLSNLWFVPNSCVMVCVFVCSFYDFNSLAPGRSGCSLKIQLQNLIYWFRLVSSDFLITMPSDDCHGTLLMTSKRWVRKWLGVISHPALYHHMVSLDHNELSDYICIKYHWFCD